jgi:ketosteroid isomerase-like protein
MEPDGLLAELLALEAAAMDRWGAGDPGGFLELSDDDVTYFDPWQRSRLDSHAELSRLYDDLRGQVKIDSYEFVAPAVIAVGDLAVLSFQFISTGSEGAMRWNTTEVYRHHADRGWRIVHSHWSLTEAGVRLDAASGGRDQTPAESSGSSPT